MQKNIFRRVFWNSGIFLINNKKLLQNFKKYHSKILILCKKIMSELSQDLDFLETDLKLMKKLPEISFDKAILEKNDCNFMIKFKQTWNDIGSWKTLSDVVKKKIKKTKFKYKYF